MGEGAVQSPGEVASNAAVQAMLELNLTLESNEVWRAEGGWDGSQHLEADWSRPSNWLHIPLAICLVCVLMLMSQFDLEIHR